MQESRKKEEQVDRYATPWSSDFYALIRGNTAASFRFSLFLFFFPFSCGGGPDPTVASFLNTNCLCKVLTHNIYT